MVGVEGAIVQLNVNRYFSLASFAILYYDYILTIPMEVERYWQREKFTWATSLFFLVRYLSIFGHLPVIVQVFSNSQTKGLCDNLITYHQAFSVIIQILVGFLLIIRTYALYERNRWILRLMLSVSAVVIGVGCWSILVNHGSSPTMPVDVGCNSSLSITEGNYLAAAWSGMLLFDFVIFFLTLYKALTLRRTARRTLLDILLRDGTLYFGCMAAANLSNILTLLFGEPLIKGVSTIFTNVVSTTLISRLMLNIRCPRITMSHRRSRSGSSSASTTLDTSFPFSTVVPAISMDFPQIFNDESIGDVDLTNQEHSLPDEIELVSR